jgi:RHS repeat-associated protein
VGKTIQDVYLVNDTNNPGGYWTAAFADIAIASTDGAVRPIYNRQKAMTLTVSCDAGVTDCWQVVGHPTNVGWAHFSTTTYYHGDHLGSSRFLSSWNATPMSEAAYLPFGEEESPQMGVNHYKFTSKERDQSSGEAGLDYFGFRYYTPVQGRWLSADKLNFTRRRLFQPSNTLNKFSYAGGNPLFFVDPDGLDITFFYRAPNGGNNDAGHFFIGVTERFSGKVKFLDYYPAGTGKDSFFPSKGEINQGMTEDRLMNHAALTIRTNPEIDKTLIAAIEKLEAETPDFHLLLNSCVSVCSDVLSLVGIDIDTLGPSTPTSLWEAVFEKYAKDASSSSTGYEHFHDFGEPFSAFPKNTRPFYNLELLRQIVRNQSQTQNQRKARKPPKPCKYKTLKGGGIQVICYD